MNKTSAKLTTYTFTVDGKVFKINAENKMNAYKAANCKVREDKLVSPSESFAWFDGVQPNTFNLGHDVFLD